jgi:hypothetical protein
MIIQLTSKIDNASLQIGDYAYYISTTSLTDFDGQAVGSEPLLIGKITNMSNNAIIVDAFKYIPIGSYIMFAKDNRVNSGSLKGYYASVKMKNTDSKQAELFAISSEVVESSK